MTITPLLIAQVVITIIFAMAIMSKLAGKKPAKEMFRKLGAEPVGRYLISVLEILAIVLLRTGNVSLGATLVILLMIGAIGSHLTKLGINKMFYMAIISLVAGAYIVLQVGLPL